MPGPGPLEGLIPELGHLPSATVPVSQLLLTGSARSSGEDSAHTRILADCDDELPPVIVHRPTMRVLDGVHRVRAAMLRGQDRIDVRFFDGDEASSFVLAVRANITHGLPLSLRDRKAAAARIIGLYPRWSDRLIASVTGLSHTTVATIRRPPASGQSGQLPDREGIDGRTRPANPGARRAAAASLLRADPAVSVRRVAKAVGLSPATVRKVREHLRRDLESAVPEETWLNSLRRTPKISANEQLSAVDPNLEVTATSLRQRPFTATTIRVSRSSDSTALILEKLGKDPSMRLTQSGREILQALRTWDVGIKQFQLLAAHVPPHWSGAIAELAKTNAAKLSALAEQIAQNASSAS
jgi:hypothetical protein